MKHSIDFIRYTNPLNESKNFTLPLNGRNLIITGNNGSGKTQFLRKLFNILDSLVIQTGVSTQNEIEEKLINEKSRLTSLNPGDILYQHRVGNVLKLEAQLSSINEFQVGFRDISSLKKEYHQRNALVRFFEATRQANITHDGTTTGISALRDYYRSQKFEKDSGSLFENYLVTIWNYCLVQAGKRNLEKAKEVSGWIESISNDLVELFEDESIQLVFNDEELCIYIHQSDKEPYRLSQLSSGFSAILSIYADLLIRVELGQLNRKEVSGIILIDEIDAHLHVTLQKKVFSFFKNSFPNIQFIITTHSPFVVQSVSDAVVFNLSTLEQMEDLSLYSYSSIIKGLLGEDSVSERLRDKVEQLRILVSADDFDDITYLDLISELEPHIDQMDFKSQTIIKQAKSLFIERQLGE